MGAGLEWGVAVKRGVGAGIERGVAMKSGVGTAPQFYNYEPPQQMHHHRASLMLSVARDHSWGTAPNFTIFEMHAGMGAETAPLRIRCVLGTSASVRAGFPRPATWVRKPDPYMGRLTASSLSGWLISIFDFRSSIFEGVEKSGRESRWCGERA